MFGSIKNSKNYTKRACYDVFIIRCERVTSLSTGREGGRTTSGLAGGGVQNMLLSLLRASLAKVGKRFVLGTSPNNTHD